MIGLPVAKGEFRHDSGGQQRESSLCRGSMRRGELMSTGYCVTIELRLDDTGQLFEAAQERAEQEGNTRCEALSLLRDAAGSVSVEDCLIMLLDPGSLPGVTLLHSSAERLSSFMDERSPAQSAKAV